MIYLICIPFLCLIGWAIWSTRDYCFDTGEMFATVFGCLFLLAILTVLPLQTLGNGKGIQEMEMFRDVNTLNYGATVNETESYLSEVKFIEGLLIEGSIEKLEQAGYVSERLKEWRDEIVKYNYQLAKLKYYNNNAFLGCLVPDKIESMVPLLLKP